MKAEKYNEMSWKEGEEISWWEAYGGPSLVAGIIAIVLGFLMSPAFL